MTLIIVSSASVRAAAEDQEGRQQVPAAGVVAEVQLLRISRYRERQHSPSGRAVLPGPMVVILGSTARRSVQRVPVRKVAVGRRVLGVVRVVLLPGVPARSK